MFQHTNKRHVGLRWRRLVTLSGVWCRRDMLARHPVPVPYLFLFFFFKGYDLVGYLVGVLWNPENVRCSVADPNPDPDPPDPHVFGPPGSGSGSTSQRYGSGSGSCSGSASGSFYYHAKNSKKNLDSFYFVTLFEFLSLKNDVRKCSFIKS
jgi:hypothetical protein